MQASPFHVLPLHVWPSLLPQGINTTRECRRLWARRRTVLRLELLEVGRVLREGAVDLEVALVTALEFTLAWRCGRPAGGSSGSRQAVGLDLGVGLPAAAGGIRRGDQPVRSATATESRRLAVGWQGEGWSPCSHSSSFVTSRSTGTVSFDGAGLPSLRKDEEGPVAAEPTDATLALLPDHAWRGGGC